tara:strand:- start:122 stop:673 length:552 start_codon:yes stop_codon:yes gene_type:complete
MTHTLSHTITLAVCTDCYFYYHYSDYLINDGFNTEHLSEEDKQNIISGFDKNSEDYNISEPDNDSDDTHFSWSNCDMCGSGLGGDRHELLLTPITPKNIFKDDRTEEQKKTHKLAIVGTDTFMSGWGLAEGGASYAGWAFEDGQYAEVLAMMNGRSDMQRVRLVSLDSYKPTAKHTHIYVYKS